MPGPSSTARKTALAVGAVITLGLVAFFVIEAPKQSEFRGMGIGLILEKQDQWRQALILEGRHLNELSTWQIQEEVARRSHLSEGGVKGLSRRASNAKDQVLAVEGHLVSGHQELAAELAWKLAPQMEASGRFTTSQVARMYRNAGDAAWQSGGRAEFTPDAAYQKGIAVLKQATDAKASGELAWLNLDLASFHWSRALFFPEDPDAEFQSIIDATAAALESCQRMKPPVPRVRLAAEKLAGVAALRWASMSRRLAGGGTSDLVIQRLGMAENSLTRALTLIPDDQGRTLAGALHHDLGLALALQAETLPNDEAEPKAAMAISHFEAALDRRPSSFQAGSMDVRDLGRRLQERAESLAALAWARRMAGHLDPAIEAARATLALTTERDASPAWITAVGVLAQVQTMRCLASDAMLEAGLNAHEAIENALAGLRHYPIDQQDAPGVPSRARLLDALGSVCEEALKRPQIPGVTLYVSDMEGVVRPIFDAVGGSTDRATFAAASAALGRILELKSRALEAELERPLESSQDAL